MRTEAQIFKAYDIRAIVPEELDAEGATQIGRAFAALVKPKSVVVGRDMRVSGPVIQPALLNGLTAAGVDVIDIGLVSTDEYYFACAEKKLPGLMVTASHNPPAYNGFKMVKEMPYFVSGKELQEWVEGKTYEDAPEKGTVVEEDITSDFDQKVLSLIEVSKIKPFKVVIDSGNGMTGPIWKRLAAHLPVTIDPLFSELDGAFPNRGPDPFQLDNQEKIRARVRETDADMGFIFDPDGDRFFLIDDRGLSIPGDFLNALLAEQELAVSPGSRIIYDVRASDALPDIVKAGGGEPVLSRVGHAYIKPLMQEKDAAFGGESSGHIYYRDFYFADSGVVPALKILEYVSAKGLPLSQILTDFENKYFLSGEINSTVKDPLAVIAGLKGKYSDGEATELDGVSIRYRDWHFNVRPSNTEPLIRLNVEASSRELMEEKRDELLALIRGDS